MNWLAIILACFKALSAAVEFLRNKQALDAATAEILSVHLKGALDEIKIANDARAAVRADAIRNPGGVRDDDGFRRD